MKLHSDASSGRNIFTGYGEGYVVVSGQRHVSNVIVLPDRVLPWLPASFEVLTEADFAPFLELDLEILLLGTGARQRFPHPRLTQALAAKRIGVEAMDVQAACRTFNILAAEQRRVAAALLIR